MKTITFVFDKGHYELIWYGNGDITYNDFCSNVLKDFLRDYGVSITSIVKTSDQGSTTTFDLTFDN